MRKRLLIEDIYTTNYYIVIRTDEKTNLDETDSTILRLEKIGVKIKRINDIRSYNNILYSFLNKKY